MISRTSLLVFPSVQIGVRMRGRCSRMRPGRLLAVAALGLAACATTPHHVAAPAASGPTAAVTPGPSYFSGRISIVADPLTSPSPAAHSAPTQRVYSAQFELQGDASQGSITLTSPLGTTLAQAQWTPGDVVLQDAQTTRHFTSLEQLSTAALGEPIPLIELFDWIQGRPNPQQPSTPQAPPGTGFSQSGWQVDLQDFAAHRLVVTRDHPYHVRMVIVLD